MRPTLTRRRLLPALVARTAVAAGLTVAALSAQQPPPTFERIPITVGRSHVLLVDFDVTRIAITNATIADANMVSPREVLIDAKAPGLTSLILWGADRRVQYDVGVDALAQPLQQQIQTQLQSIFPKENIRVTTTDEAIVLSGEASSSDAAQRAGEIAQAFSAKLKLVNLLLAPVATDAQQVILEVQFAEVEHTALTEVGASFLLNRSNGAGGISTQQFPTARPDDSAGRNDISVPDYLNVFFFLRREGFLAVIKALRDRGVFQSLAEPNLVAYNGKPASFLAGGEFPVPYLQGTSGQVTVQFKEFGVRLTFTPTITGNVIRLNVKPEVSTIDYQNGVTLSGFRIPALKTRRAETDVELVDGQSFAIAGLLDNQAATDAQSIPVLSALPIIGSFFKSNSKRAVRTELLVLITVHLFKTGEGTAPPLPTMDPKLFIEPDNKTSTGTPGAKP